MDFDVPADLYYLETHEWVDPATGRIGITDFAQDELGDVVFVELPQVGETVQQDSRFGVVESVKAVSDLYAPVDGRVSETNDAIAETPELVNDDPFGAGWLLAVEAVEESDLDALLTAAEYRDQIA